MTPKEMPVNRRMQNSRLASLASKQWLSSWPLILTLFIVSGAGFVQHSFIQRERKSREQLESKVASLSLQISDWDQEDLKLDPDSQTLAGIRAYKELQLRHDDGADQATVLIACGPHGDIVGHRPEICVVNAGLRQDGPTATVELVYGDSKKAVFSYSDFVGETVGREGRFRVYYAFNAGMDWVALTDPRRDFDDPLPYLLKVYVTVPQTKRQGIDEKSVHALVKEFLPQVDQQLALGPSRANFGIP